MNSIMKALIFLFMVFVGVNASMGVTVRSQVRIRCKAPMSPKITVMLMERDLGGSPFDEDDTLDFGEYYIGSVPEQRLVLEGKDFEFTGLEPYLFIYHSCTNQTNTWSRLEVDLMEYMYKSKFFDVVIDLDTMKHVIKDKDLKA